MKKSMKKLLALILVLVLSLSNLGGLGPVVSKAAYVDNTLLKVKVVDGEGNPVKNVELFMESLDYPSYGSFKLGPTDADGIATRQLEYEMDGAFELKPAAESGFTCDTPVEIDLGVDSAWKTIVEYVNGEDYTGEIVLTVSGEAVVKPVITSVTPAKTSITKDGETLTFTVKGENLPDTLYYTRHYDIVDEYGPYTYAVEYSGVEVAAEGTATEKTIQVPIPAAADTYAAALAWKVKVGLSASTSDGSYKVSSDIAIEGVEAPKTPEIKEVVTKESVSASGETVTVTVKGENLPDTVYYKVLYTCEEFASDSSVNYQAKSIALTGTDTEKTFEVAIPATSEFVEKVTGWKVGVSTTQYGTLVKSALIAIDESTEPGTPDTPDVPETPTVDKNVLNIKVEDKDGNAVSGVALYMEGNADYDAPDVNLGATDAEGKISYALKSEFDTYYLKPTADSGYTCASPVKLYIDYDYTTFKQIVKKVNDEEYTGEVVLVVEKEEVEEPAEPVITSVTTAKTTVSAAGEEVVVTVKGENLPEKLYYSRQYNIVDEYGPFTTTADFTGVEVTAEGTATERTIVVPIPGTSGEYASALAWIVRVGLSSSTYDGTYKKTAEIAIDGVEEPKTPVIKEVLTKESVSADGETITVTVKGENLPDTVYYKVFYTCEEFTSESSVNYQAKAITLTGTDTEKTFEVAIPATSEMLETITGWKVGVALTQYGTQIKSALISLAAEEEPVDKTELIAELDRLSAIEQGDYTLESYDNLQNAIQNAEAVKNNDKASEEEVAAAIASLKDAEAKLVVEEKVELPAAPASAKAVLSGGHNDVKVTWDAVDGADGYLFYFKKATSTKWSNPIACTETTYTRNNLASNVKYNFKVVSYVEVDGEKYFNADDAATVNLTTKKNVKAPATVKATLSGGYDDVKISWTKVEGADGYYVSMKKAGATVYTRIATTTSLSYVKKNLTDGVKYTFQVAPYYNDGTTKVRGFYSKTATVTTLKKLATPKVVKSTSKKVKVSWTNIAGETGYQISRSTKKTGTNIVSTYATTSGKTKTLTVTKGKKYYYKVRAYKTVDGKKIYGPWSAAKAYTLK